MERLRGTPEGSGMVAVYEQEEASSTRSAPNRSASRTASPSPRFAASPTTASSSRRARLRPRRSPSHGSTGSPGSSWPGRATTSSATRPRGLIPPPRPDGGRRPPASGLDPQRLLLRFPPLAPKSSRFPFKIRYSDL